MNVNEFIELITHIIRIIISVHFGFIRDKILRISFVPQWTDEFFRNFSNSCPRTIGQFIGSRFHLLIVVGIAYASSIIRIIIDIRLEVPIHYW